VCGTLLTELLRHEDCWPFTDPVDISEVPDYLEVVSCPMDFGTIKRKLNAFEYNSFEECISDIQLVFANSDQYNLVSLHGRRNCLSLFIKNAIPPRLNVSLNVIFLVLFRVHRIMAWPEFRLKHTSKKSCQIISQSMKRKRSQNNPQDRRDRESADVKNAMNCAPSTRLRILKSFYV
jgi:hypothetical protein